MRQMLKFQRPFSSISPGSVAFSIFYLESAKVEYCPVYYVTTKHGFCQGATIAFLVDIICLSFCSLLGVQFHQVLRILSHL